MKTHYPYILAPSTDYRFCDQGHALIRFEGKECPCCLLQEELAMTQRELDRARGR